jgi:AmmeMemoRadiSam system protein A
MTYNHQEKDILLTIAKKSILHGLENGQPLPVELTQYSEVLRQIRAVFVTLELKGHLRGCIGTLQALEPLVQAVAHYAFEAAFKDPRFPAVTAEEAEDLDIALSVLSPAESIFFESEQDLIGQLRPNIDGLILIEKGYSGTFLPSVWSQLNNPKEFLDHLKMKAGLPHHYWSDTIQIKRYTTEMIK